ncbi:MAG: hypothetical protein H7Z41_17910, partial [Cytophagales bacterium]|nr:hypothetical protein [Armatimonadota bacterium]
IVLAPMDRQEFERQIEAARAALGEDVFSREWEWGRALTWEQAAAYALGEASTAAPQV